MTVDVSDRWMHGRQRPEFTRHHAWSDRIRIDSALSGPAGRTLVAATPAHRGGLWTHGHAVHDAAGRPLRFDAALPPDSGRDRMGVDSITVLDWDVMVDDEPGTLRLPAARLWEVVPTWAPEAPRPRASWTDSLDFSTSLGDFRQSLAGRRVSTIEKDTVVGGRRLWIVRDSARVRYAERWLRFERTLGAPVAVERSAGGVIRGRHLFDPTLRLFRARDDSTVLAGEAVLRYPDGRAFRTPARYERTRHWTLYDAKALALRDSIRRREEDAAHGGMLIFPREGVETRLARGDARLEDSLVAAWHRSRDPDERARVMDLLDQWGDEPDRGYPRRLRELALQAGDTAWALLDIRGDFYTTLDRRPDVWELERVLPLMDDPAISFAMGIDLDPFYENLRQGLLWHPPALDPESSWSCTRAACELLAAQRTRAREPRLRALGLITSLVLDPPRWADTVLAEARGNPAFFQGPVQLIRGVAAAGRASSRAPLPPPEAGWRAWLEWMEGRDPTYVPYFPSDRGWHVVFGDNHLRAMRFADALTGRGVAGEIRAKLAAATEDSARLVYSAILAGLGERMHTPEELAARLRSPNATEREAALREVPGLFDTAAPADSAAAAELMDRLLAVLVENAAPWPTLPGDSLLARTLRGVGESSLPVYIIDDSLPAAVRARWATRAHVLTAAEWGTHSPREAALIVRVTRPVQAGPFARLRISYTSHYPHRADESPAGYAGGATVTVVQLDGRWVLIRADTWV
ncbi:MAG TPA: hypothetical protein VF771_07005, partial [Longimicrobiaceae bacterium]